MSGFLKQTRVSNVKSQFDRAGLRGRLVVVGLARGRGGGLISPGLRRWSPPASPRPAKLETLAEVETRYRALTEALEWLLEAGRTDDALRLASTLVPFWIATKRIDDGDDVVRPRAQSSDGTEATALGRLRLRIPRLLDWTLRPGAANGSSRRSRARGGARRPDLEALALAGCARCRSQHRREEAVRMAPVRAVERHADLPDSLGDRARLHVLGVALQMSGDLEDARES